MSKPYSTRNQSDQPSCFTILHLHKILLRPKIETVFPYFLYLCKLKAEVSVVVSVTSRWFVLSSSAKTPRILPKGTSYTVLLEIRRGVFWSGKQLVRWNAELSLHFNGAACLIMSAGKLVFTRPRRKLKPDSQQSTQRTEATPPFRFAPWDLFQYCMYDSESRELFCHFKRSPFCHKTNEI